MSDELRKLAELRAFLDGSGTLQGVSIAEIPEGERGRYWWRKHLVLIDEAADELTALRAKVKRQAEALREIAKPTYGTEISMSDEERAEILGRHLFARQDIARRAAQEATDE